MRVLTDSRWYIIPYKMKLKGIAQIKPIKKWNDAQEDDEAL